MPQIGALFRVMADNGPTLQDVLDRINVLSGEVRELRGEVRELRKDMDRQFRNLREGQASIKEELGTMMSKKDLATLRAELKTEAGADRIVELQRDVAELKAAAGQ